MVFCAKYPFTKEAKDYLASISADFSKIGDETLEAASERVKSSLASGRSDRLKQIKSSKYSYLVNEILTFPLAKILAGLNGDYFVRKQFASAEAKDVYYFLQLDSDDNLMKVADQVLSIEKKGGRFAVPVIEYLNNIPEGKEYKLVNAELERGKVLLEKETIAKLVSKYVFNSIISTSVDKKKVPKTFIFFADELSKHGRESFAKMDFGPLNPDYFPPCIKSIVVDLRSGEKTAHQPRFVLATFFASINMPVDAAIEYFSQQPNFNEKKTRYYLEHALGKKGGTKYSMPACVTIESYGLCKRDATCRWKHPLTYYKAMKTKRKEVKKK